MRRKSQEEGERLRRGVYILPNLFTTFNLFCGFYTVISAVNGRYLHAAVAAVCIFDLKKFTTQAYSFHGTPFCFWLWNISYTHHTDSVHFFIWKKEILPEVVEFLLLDEKMQFAQHVGLFVLAMVPYLVI